MGFFLLICLAILSGLAAIWTRQRYRQLYTLLKPLTTLIIFLVAFTGRAESLTTYRFWILAGLVFGFLGDVILLNKKAFIAGLLSFLMGHIFYVLAFSSGRGLAFSHGGLLPIAIYGVVMYGLLFPYLKHLKAPVFLYMLAITFMGWQAWERWLNGSGLWSLYAAIGALLFIASDSILAVNHFQNKWESAHRYRLGVYYLGQLLIALSILQ